MIEDQGDQLRDCLFVEVAWVVHGVENAVEILFVDQFRETHIKFVDAYVELHLELVEAVK